MNNSVALPACSPPLAVAVAVVFLISLAFPVTAGLAKNTAAFSKWWGMMDVAIAFVLVILVFVIMALTLGKVGKQVEDTTCRVYRVLLHGILVMLVVFFLFGSRITWINCITGFAWRAWLLLLAGRRTSVAVKATLLGQHCGGNSEARSKSTASCMLSSLRTHP